MSRIFFSVPRVAIALLLVCNFFGEISTNKVNAKDVEQASSQTPNASDILSGNIKDSFRNISISEEQKNDFIKMVMEWRSKDGKPLLLTLKERLDGAIADRKSEKTHASNRVEVECSVARILYDGLVSKLDCDQEIPAFTEIVEFKKANPVDYALIFKILADSIGLNAKVLEYINGPGTDIHSGFPLMCCMIFLNDGKVVLVNFGNHDLSSPFVLSEFYKESGYCWRTITQQKDHCGTFYFWDDKGIKAYIVLENSLLSLSGSRDYYAGIKEIDKFLALCPHSTLGYLAKEALCEGAKQNDMQLDLLNQAIRIYPEFDMAYYRRSVSYAKIGDYQNMVKDLDKVIEFNPNFWEAYSFRAMAHGRLAEYEQAAADLSMAIGLNSKQPKLYLLRGFSYMQMKQYDNALSDFTKAIDLDPNLMDAYMYRAKTEYNMDRVKEAEADALKFLKLKDEQARKGGEGEKEELPAASGDTSFKPLGESSIGLENNFAP